MRNVLGRLDYLRSVMEAQERRFGVNSERAERAVRIMIDFEERHANLIAEELAHERWLAWYDKEEKNGN